MGISEIFKKHERAVLMYSGGKDSLALLMLLRPYWDRISVVWVDTGDQFPEVREHMQIVSQIVPHFEVLLSNVTAFHAHEGYPVNVVPTRYTAFGQMCFGKKPICLCSRFQCCATNIWEPMARYIAWSKTTCVIRGDRNSERLEGPREFNGVEYVFPIFDWTAEQVMELVRQAPAGLYQERHELPEGSSLDCRMCTAYEAASSSRMTYMRKHHPEVARHIEWFMPLYRSAVAEEMEEK